jgi:hypothetical protein
MLWTSSAAARRLGFGCEQKHDAKLIRNKRRSWGARCQHECPLPNDEPEPAEYDSADGRVVSAAAGARVEAGVGFTGAARV